MHIKANLNHIQNYLTKNQFLPQFQKETNQIFIVNQRLGVETATFLRLLSENKLLQIITFIPLKIRKETLIDLSRLLHKLNRDIDFPGFGMDESTGMVFFRVVMPCLNEQCDGELLLQHLKNVPQATSAFYNLIASIIMGNKTFEELYQSTAN